MPVACPIARRTTVNHGHSETNVRQKVSTPLHRSRRWIPMPLPKLMVPGLHPVGMIGMPSVGENPHRGPVMRWALGT